MRFAFHHMRRQLASDPRSLLALIVVVLISALLTTSVLRLLTDAETRQAQYDLAAASPWQREPSSYIQPGGQVFHEWPEGMEGEFQTPYEVLADAMWKARGELPEPMRSQLIDTRAVTESSPFNITGGIADGQIRNQELVMRTDPRLDEIAELLEGRWPESTPRDWSTPPTFESDDGEPLDAFERLAVREEPEQHPVEIAISQHAAELAGWEIGDEFTSNTHPFVLVGIYEANDSLNPYWGRIANAAEAYYYEDMNLGPVITFSAYAHESWGASIPGSGGYAADTGSTAILWYVVDETQLHGGDLELAAAQYRSFASELTPLDIGGYEFSTRFYSETPNLLEGSLDRIDVVRSVLALIAVGPLAILLSVLGLGVRLIVERRTKSTAQLAARGASTGQIVIPSVIEGLLVSIPAAVIGTAIAYAATPGPWNWLHVMPAFVLALVPGLMLAVSTRRAAQGRTGRADLGGRASRWRLVAEVAVVLVAGLALFSLFSGNSAVGQLVAPIAVTGALIVLALRIYPLPVRIAERAASRRRAAPAFVGLARARRSPSGGLVPVIALVAGVGAALLAAVLWSTVNHGAQATAWQQVGGPVRASGPVFYTEDLDEITGINDYATISDLRSTRIASVGNAQLIAVDSEAMNRIQDGAPGIDPVLFGDTDSGAVPVLVTEGVELDPGDTVNISGLDVEVTGIIERLGGFSMNELAIVVDRDAWQEATGTNVWPRIAIIDADPEAVSEAYPTARIETPQTTGADFIASPLGFAMSVSLVAGLAVAAALIALTVFLMQLLDAPARTRVTAVMRTMGVYPAEVRSITATSMLPTVLISLVTGLIAGFGLPWLLTISADLRPLTGSEFQPQPVYDPLVLGGVIASIVVVMAIAVWWAARAAGKASLARELRSVEG